MEHRCDICKQPVPNIPAYLAVQVRCQRCVDAGWQGRLAVELQSIRLELSEPVYERQGGEERIGRR